MVCVHAPVGQDQDIHPVGAGLVAGSEETGQRTPELFFLIIQKGDGPHPEVRAVNRADPFQFFLGQYRRGQFQHSAVVRPGVQQVAVVADIYGAVRLDLFAQCVDRRVGHLRETLAEVIVKRRVRLRQRRHRHVRAHGSDGFGGVLRHREDHVAQVFPGIPEGAAQPCAFLSAAGFRLFLLLRQVLQADQLLHPFAVGMQARVIGLQFFAFQQLSAGQVRLQHFAAGQLPPAHDMRALLRQHTRFGGKDQPPVVRQRAAQRAQAVPVQGRAYVLTVGVQDGRRAVPGLHHRGIIAVHIPPGRGIIAFRKLNRRGCTLCRPLVSLDLSPEGFSRTAGLPGFALPGLR